MLELSVAARVDAGRRTDGLAARLTLADPSPRTETLTRILAVPFPDFILPVTAKTKTSSPA
jgi:hypothetical protein